MYITNFLIHGVFVLLYSMTAADEVEVTTATTTIVFTTRSTDMDEKDNVAEEDVNAALNQDGGAYSTMQFDYFNDQFINWYQDKEYRCYEDYIRCLVSQTVRVPVCVLRNVDRKLHFFRTLSSICDMYFYNCRCTYRYIFVFKNHACYFYNDKNQGEPIVQVYIH